MTVLVRRGPSLQVDEALNDSDKTLSVPAGMQWKVLWVYVGLITTATVGNRLLELTVVDDSSDIIYSIPATFNQAASLTNAYGFVAGVTRGTISGGVAIEPIPHDLMLPAAYGIRLRDANAVDAAADDLDIQMMVVEEAVVL